VNIGMKFCQKPKAATNNSYFFDTRQEIIDTLNTKIKPMVISLANDIVGNWEHKPSFGFSSNVSKDEISLYFEPTGPNAKYWTWTSSGTRPHLIVAKRAKRLRFRGGYVPKTTPAPSWGGPGIANGDWTQKYAVNHPGTTPRNFEQYIAKQIKDDYKREIENAFKRAGRM